jgi:hypothetical protein
MNARELPTNFNTGEAVSYNKKQLLLKEANFVV